MNRFWIPHEYYQSNYTKTYAEEYLLPESPGDITDLSTLEHIRGMKQTDDNDLLK